MEGRVSGTRVPPLVGRRDVLDQFARLLDRSVMARPVRQAWPVSPARERRGCSPSSRPMPGARHAARCGGGRRSSSRRCPFGAVVDALDDRLETLADGAARPARRQTVAPAGGGLPLAGGEPLRRPGCAARRHGPGPLRRLPRGTPPAGGDRPSAGLVLILDDLHWADEASVELLDHLVRHPPRGRILIASPTGPRRRHPGWPPSWRPRPASRSSPLNEAEVDGVPRPAGARHATP